MGYSETLAHLEWRPEVPWRRLLPTPQTCARRTERPAGATSPSAGASEEIRQEAHGWQEVELNEMIVFRRIGDKRQS